MNCLFQVKNVMKNSVKVIDDISMVLVSKMSPGEEAKTIPYEKLTLGVATFNKEQIDTADFSSPQGGVSLGNASELLANETDIPCVQIKVGIHFTVRMFHFPSYLSFHIYLKYMHNVSLCRLCFLL